MPCSLLALDLSSCRLSGAPALAGLTRLIWLGLSRNVNIDSGWERLPPQLRFLELAECALPEVPPELAARRSLTVMTSLQLIQAPPTFPEHVE